MSGSVTRHVRLRRATDWRVDLCRASYAAWAAGDPEALVKLYEPDSEWDLGPMAGIGLGPVYHRHAGLRELLGEFTGAFEGFAPRIMKLRVLGEQLLVRADAIGKSRLMGIETTNAPYGQVAEFRNRRGLRVTFIEDPPPNWDEAQRVE